ncbi:MAG: YibE/F family protein [Microgenomates group bacterium]
MIKKIFIFFLLFLSTFIFLNKINLLDNQATITKKFSEDNEKIIFDAKKQDKTIKVYYFKNNLKDFLPNINNKVIIEKINNKYIIVDFYRLPAIFYLLLIFLILSILILKKEVFGALISLFFSFLIIFSSIIPNIIANSNPFVVVMIASLFMIPINFYLTHGFNKKTNAAILGSLFGILISIIISLLFTKIGYITGTVSEEIGFLSTMTSKNYDFQGIFLASILIGVIGSIDDVTITQSTIVEKIINNNKNLKFSDIYKQAMDVGKDHINSIINTLILVYASASLPLLLLFQVSNKNFFSILNYEIVASEIVRTITATISIILVIPLTTYFAIKIFKKD